jgi:hypothetical protein
MTVNHLVPGSNPGAGATSFFNQQKINFLKIFLKISFIKIILIQNNLDKLYKY